jgi:hypothetical protein
MKDAETTLAVKDAVGAAAGGYMHCTNLNPYERWLFELYGREAMGLFG